MTQSQFSHQNVKPDVHVNTNTQSLTGTINSSHYETRCAKRKKKQHFLNAAVKVAINIHCTTNTIMHEITSIEHYDAK